MSFIVTIGGHQRAKLCPGGPRGWGKGVEWGVEEGVTVRTALPGSSPPPTIQVNFSLQLLCTNGSICSFKRILVDCKNWVIVWLVEKWRKAERGLYKRNKSCFAYSTVFLC